MVLVAYVYVVKSNDDAYIRRALAASEPMMHTYVGLHWTLSLVTDEIR